jgi:hypothetical protein
MGRNMWLKERSWASPMCGVMWAERMWSKPAANDDGPTMPTFSISSSSSSVHIWNRHATFTSLYTTAAEEEVLALAPPPHRARPSCS